MTRVCEIGENFHMAKISTYTAYARSSSAYNALWSFRLLQLPSVSILKQYKSSYTERPGEVESRLKEESDIYRQRQKEAKEKGKLVPLGEGSLILMKWKLRQNFSGTVMITLS